MKCLISKGFKYLVALFIILSCVSVRAMAKETNDTADQGNRITEKGNTSKNETFDTTDELMSNDPKKSISSQDSASDKGKNAEASSTKDSVKTEYTFEDSKIKVKAVLKKADAVSDQAELKVKEIPENTTEYKKYENALNKKDNAYSNVLLYDISFILNGKEVEPADGSVKVSMEFKDQQLSDDLKVKSASDLKVIHFKDNNVNKQESLEATTNVKNETTSFETKSFSTYALIDSTNATKVEGFDFKSLDKGYGIIARSYNQTGDCESNIYVDTVEGFNGQYFGSSGRFTNAGGNNYIGNLSSEMFKYGSPEVKFHVPPAKVYLGSNIYSDDITKHNENGFDVKIKSGSYKDKVIQFINIGRDAFTSASGMDTANQVITNVSNKYKSITSYGNKINGDKNTVNLKGLPAGTYVVTYNGSNLGADGNNLNVEINKDQHLIVYCPTTEDMNLSNYMINGRSTKNENGGIVNPDGDNESTYLEKKWELKCVSFYMPNTHKVTFKETCGIFVAPNAECTSDATSGGIVYCNHMYVGNGEWHYRNSHLESPADLVFKAKKSFSTNWPTNGTYKIILKDIQKNNNNTYVKELTQSKSVDSFDKFTYSADGNYFYEIYEDSQNPLPNVTYDQNIYHIMVKVSSVTENNSTRYYVSNVYCIKDTNKNFSYTESGHNWTEMNLKTDDIDGYVAKFTNSYTGQNETNVIFQINKTVNGKSPGNKSFNFGLQEKKDGTWSSDEQTAANDSNGNVKFTSIIYDEAGKHLYKIYEKDVPSNYTSSGPIYVKVTVINSDNKLKAEVKYYSDEACATELNDPVINNETKTTSFKLKKVDADSTTTTLSGAKFILYKATLNDKTLTKGDQFGKEMTTDSTGLATFSKLTYGSTYLLVETQAPDAYNANGPWAVQIDESGNITLTKISESNDNLYTLSSKNDDIQTKKLGYTDSFEISDKKKEYTLPSTGGNGTKTYYMIGTLLSMLGIIYVVFKKGKGGLLRNKKNL